MAALPPPVVISTRACSVQSSYIRFLENINPEERKKSGGGGGGDAFMTGDD